MKKLISAIIIIIAIVAVIFLALPKYYSSQSKQYMQGFLQGLEQGSNGALSGKVIKSSEGWFSSKATVEIDYKLATNAPKDMQKELSGKIDLDLTTHYGPIFITQQGVKFGRAIIDYQLNNNAEIAKYLKNPLLKGDALVGFNGDMAIQFSGLSAIQSKEVNFNGLSASFIINKAQTKTEGTIKYDQLEINDSKNGKVTFAPFTQTFDMSRPSTNDLWGGSKVITFPSITVSSPNFKGQFNQVTIKSNATINQNSLNGNLSINAPTFTANTYTGQFHTNMAMKNLNASALYQLRDFVNKMRDQTLNDKQIAEMTNKIIELVVDTFSGESSIQFDSKLSVNNIGNMILNTGYDNSDPTSKINFTLQLQREDTEVAGITLKIDDIDKSTLGKLMRLSATLNPETGEPLSQDQLNAKFSKLAPELFTPTSQIDLNIIMPEARNVGFQLLNAKAYFKNLPKNPTLDDLMTTAQLDADWKIPTYAVGMMQAFAPTIISKLKDVDNTLPAKSTYEIFKELLPMMIQQGYLQQQGNYYLSNWDISIDGVMMNNQSLQPLIEEVAKMQEQQKQQAAAATQSSTTNSTPTLPTQHPSLNSPVQAPTVMPMGNL